MREMLKMIVVLSLICGLAGLSLASLKKFTAPHIVEQELTFVQGPAIAAVFPTFNNDPVKERHVFTIPDTDQEITVFPAKKDDKLLGVAFETKSRGYGGQIGVMVGFTFDPGTVQGIGVTTMKETPGIGARVAKHGFTGQFRGHELTNLELRSQGGDIDAVSGATISSTASVMAVKKALSIYTALKDDFRRVFAEAAQQ
ncbi:electron transport complex protein RnfG [Paucidesulfovibrio gracilis DSM 16080]|uniref:Ion-translocating oxidoreductase complex subunit G n=1 Tax=Paucidesulfovibrio gracilis DSM 16080 TaxID=1121449 RepID=A0A1T4XAT8_9BACT|nr:RnfABCDGE type electron transport complex subunit G [Paucidesulfovibrio gracilis]SKA86696.1 electron transport complex protein RnfG [Paucidesulfovibrio gracilis DSM 16080]